MVVYLQQENDDLSRKRNERDGVKGSRKLNPVDKQKCEEGEPVIYIILPITGNQPIRTTKYQ